MNQNDLSEEERVALQRGIEDMEAGRTIPIDEVRRTLLRVEERGTRPWEETSFWDVPPEELNWFGKLLHRIRNWFA